MNDTAKHHGGLRGKLVFFSALLATLLLAWVLSLGSLRIVQSISQERIVGAMLGALIGLSAALLFVRGRFAVFLHEKRHAVVANLSGHKMGKMKLRNEHGSFEFSYSPQRAHMNVFVALAPYILPLALPFFLLIAATVLESSAGVRSAVIAGAFTFDLAVCFREIHPHQTDFQLVPGGILPSLIFIVAVHCVFGAFTLAWITSEWHGLRELGRFMFDWGLQIVRG